MVALSNDFMIIYQYQKCSKILFPHPNQNPHFADDMNILFWEVCLLMFWLWSNNDKIYTRGRRDASFLTIAAQHFEMQSGMTPCHTIILGIHWITEWCMLYYGHHCNQGELHCIEVIKHSSKAAGRECRKTTRKYWMVCDNSCICIWQNHRYWGF